MYKKNRKRGPQGVTQTTEYLGSYALPLLRTNARILRLFFEAVVCFAYAAYSDGVGD